jgi:hypothetical protein
MILMLLLLPVVPGAVDVADLIGRARLAVGEPESQLDNPGLPPGERDQHGLQLVSTLNRRL